MPKPPFTLSYRQLLFDLHEAYYDARRHKRSRCYQQKFEADMENNLRCLANELYTRTYKPRPSTCFIITEPKKREVFAADFRDRIVHHLYFNYVHEIFERTFITDSYSCIKGRGTHYGISRLQKHIASESLNYTEPCYILKMDIRGYFMHIDRSRLLGICLRKLQKMKSHRVSSSSSLRWFEVVDFDFVEYLTRLIVLLEPLDDCRIVGSHSDWDDLPHDKSLFFSGKGCGLPIGNLTSQLFSNVYLGELDQYMKRELKCRHYGRYVDDFYVVSVDRDWLKSLVPKVHCYLNDNLGLALHDGKTCIYSATMGVGFLGAYLKPCRNYIDSSSLHRMQPKLSYLCTECNPRRLQARLNSFLGILSHYASFNIRRNLFFSDKLFIALGSFRNWGLVFVPYM